MWGQREVKTAGDDGTSSAESASRTRPKTLSTSAAASESPWSSSTVFRVELPRTMACTLVAAVSFSATSALSSFTCLRADAARLIACTFVAA